MSSTSPRLRSRCAFATRTSLKNDGSLTTRPVVADGLRLFLADASRIVVRRSGTEPKIKVYLEVIEAVCEPHALATARHTATGRLAAIRAHLEQLTQL